MTNESVYIYNNVLRVNEYIIISIMSRFHFEVDFLENFIGTKVNFVRTKHYTYYVSE